MLTTSVLLSFLIALLRGGDLRRLGGNTIKLWWLLVLAFAIKFLAQSSYGPQLGLTPYGPAINTASFAVVLGVLLWNRDLPWAWLIAVGVALNLVVVALNGGQMPVFPEALLALGKEASLNRIASGGDPKHSAVTEATRLPWLGAWLPVPGPMSAAASPGDVVMAIGVMLFVNTIACSPAYAAGGDAAS